MALDQEYYDQDAAGQFKAAMEIDEETINARLANDGQSLGLYLGDRFLVGLKPEAARALAGLLLKTARYLETGGR